MAKKKAVSNGYLLSLWRKKVLDVYGHKCLFCGMYGDENLQCHHVVYRRRKFLRYDYRNGVPLCLECHHKAHTKAGELLLAKLHPYYDYVVENEQIVFKQYMVDNGMTEDEFLLEKKRDLLDNKI